MQRAELQALGAVGRAAVRAELSKNALCDAFCDVVVRGLPAPSASGSVAGGAADRGLHAASVADPPIAQVPSE